MERWRNSVEPFSALAGRGVGCGVAAYTPLGTFNPPPSTILGGWGGTQVEGKQQILEMRLADASYHFYLWLLSVLR
ncbi:hypothetical protein ES708_12618 [subsurface metagenome]